MSRISNSVSSQDDMQDINKLKSFIHYDTIDGEIESTAFEVHFATNFGKENGPNRIESLFDKYSDFYVNLKDFRARGGTSGADEDGGTIVTPPDDEESGNGE